MSISNAASKESHTTSLPLDVTQILLPDEIRAIHKASQEGGERRGPMTISERIRIEHLADSTAHIPPVKSRVRGSRLRT